MPPLTAAARAVTAWLLRRMYIEHTDIAVADAARGCLLQLGQLNDEAAERAVEVTMAATGMHAFDATYEVRTRWSGSPHCGEDGDFCEV